MAYLFGHIVGLTEGAFLDKTVAVAQAKIADPPLVAFVSGIGCNIFVCLAVYLGALAKSYLGKMFGLWFPVMVFVVCGFQHVVANAFIIPAAIFHKVPQSVGGIICRIHYGYFRQCRWQSFMAVPLIFMTKPATVKPRVEKTIQTEELMAIEVPNMIQIGSTGRNSGKTTLAEALIKQYQEVYPIYGLKIITISGQRGCVNEAQKDAEFVPVLQLVMN